MSGGTIVPHNNSIRAPLDTSLAITSPVDVVEQEAEDVIYIHMLKK